MAALFGWRFLYELVAWRGTAPVLISVAPGPTQTGWIDDNLEKDVLPLIPMGKLIQPEDMAKTILFLASEQARMLTGNVIKVYVGHAL